MTPDFTQFYAVDDKKRALGEPLRTKVIEAALAILNARPEVEEAFSLKELLSHKVKRSAQSDYSPRDRYALSVMEGRSGDIIVAFKSGIATGPAVPTGSPHGAQRALSQRHGRPHRFLVAGDERTDPDPAGGHHHDRANACEHHRCKGASRPRRNVFRSGLPWRAEM